MPSLAQQRAADAWEKAYAVDKAQIKDYANYAKGLPALMMNSGLMQVMAFLQQKGGLQAKIGEQLRQWLHQRCNSPKDFTGFMTHAFTIENARDYQAMTTEALAWLKWLRQMATALQGEG